VGDFSRDVLPIGLAMGVARSVPRLGYRVTPRLAPVDSSDTAPAWATTFDRSHPYSLACIARRDDEDRDRRVESQQTPDMDRCGRFCEVPRPSPVWQPRHGGGAHLVVGGVVVVEIEPMGPGWWVSAGGGDLVNGTLGEAKVRALELLSGVDDRPDRPRHC
jgi:hypothetical protein